jgi:hypothetical protein
LRQEVWWNEGNEIISCSRYRVEGLSTCNGARLRIWAHLKNDFHTVVVESGQQLSTRCAVTDPGGLIPANLKLSENTHAVVQGLKIRQ